SHTPEHPKFRLVMPLAFPVPAEDWPKVWSWAEEVARFEIDPSMKSPAATYALPAVPHRAWPREAFSRPGAILDPVDEGILERRSVLELSPKRPPAGVPSVIRGEDPEHEYVDHADPEAVYFVDEEWDEADDWEPSPELVAAVASGARTGAGASTAAKTSASTSAAAATSAGASASTGTSTSTGTSASTETSASTGTSASTDARAPTST